MLLTSSKPMQSASDRANDRAFVILDANIKHLPLLLDDLPAAADIFLLDPAQDGVEQITEALQARRSVASLHLISHGAPGSLQLGSTELSFATLHRYASQLQIWSQALEGRDLLIYGCQVAKGALGYLFLQQLQQLTGANIVASEQSVGRVNCHTNWQLDTRLGAVQTPVIFSEQLQANYPGHFETVNFSVNTDTLIESEGTPFSFNFTVDGPIPEGGSVVRFEADVPQAINQWNLFDLTLEGIDGEPVDVSPNQDFSAFEVTIVEPNASISLPVFNDFVDDSPQTFVWTVTPVSPGTTVSNGTATVTIFDDPSEVPAQPPAIPEVSLTSDITTVVEDEGTEVTFTLSLSEPSADPVLVTVDLDKPFGLGDFDVFAPPPQATATGGQLVGSTNDSNGSGFTFAITEQTATITLPVFDDPDRVPDGTVSNPDDELRNDDQGEEQTTFTLQPGDGYTVAPNANSVTLTLLDSTFVNTPPEADDDSYSAEFDTALTVNAASGVLDGDTDADGDALTAAIASDPSSGSVTLNADGSFTYTPNAGFSGDDSFTYTVTDANGGTDTATVTVTVADAPPPPNAAPEADDDSYSTEFDTALTVDAASGVLDGDTDADGDPLTAAIATEPSSGTVTLNADGSFTYTPNAGFSGDDSFTYTVADGNGGTDEATVTVTVGDAPPPPNAAPEADDDSYSTEFDTALTVDAASGVLDGDTDGDGDTLTAAIATEPSSGTVTLNADGSFAYTPNAGFSGTDSFTYTVSDGNGGTDTGAVTVTVGDAPPPPGDPVVSFSTTPEVVSEADGTSLVLNFNVEGDIPAEGLTVSLTGDTAGILQQFTAAQTRFDDNLEPFFFLDAGVRENVTGGVLEQFALDDDPSSSGFLSNFTFTITEPTASITLPVLDDVIEEDDTAFTYTLQEGDGYAVNPDASSSTSTVTDGSDVVGPTVGVTADTTTLIEDEQTRVELTFTVEGDLPPEGVVVVLDGADPRAIAEFDVTASNPRDPEDELEVDGPIVSGGNIVGTNEIASALLFRITEPTATLSVEVFNDDDAEGLENFTYTLVDGEGYEVDPAASTVDITIDDATPPPTNVDPEAAADSATTAFETEVSINVLANDTDADGDTLSLTEVGDAANGTAAIVAGEVVYTPDAAFSGTDSFSYTISDGNGGTAEATVTVDVGNPPPPDPLVVGISASPTALVEEEGTVTTVTFNLSEAPSEGGVEVTLDSDIPGSLAEFDVNAAVFSGLQLFAANEDASGFTVLVTEQTATIELPVFDDDINEGIEEITYALQASDDYVVDGAAGSVTLSIDDNDDPVVENTPPVADDDSYTTTVDTPLTVAAVDGVLNGDTDADGDSLVATFVGNPSNGTVELNEDGSFTYTPNAGFTGTDSFTYQANDGQDNSAIATVTIDVGDVVPELPVVSFAIEPAAVSEEGENPQVEVTFSVDGEVPEPVFDADGQLVSGGLSILFSGPLNELFNQISGDPETTTIVGGSFFDQDTNTSEFILLDENASATLTIFNDVIQEGDQEFAFSVAPNDAGLIDSAYSVNPDASSDSVTISDDNGGPGVGPTVGISVTQTELTEGDEFTLNFSVDGDVSPENPLTVLIDSETFAALGEFVLFNEDGSPAFTATGIEGVPEVGDTGASSFLVNLVDPNASITLSVFDDGPGEGAETLTFSVIDGEVYEVSETDDSVTVTIDDGAAPADPVVSFTASTDSLNEAEGTPLIYNFTVAVDFPEEGIIIRLDENFFDTDDIDFNIFEENGLEFVDFEETSPGRFTLDYRLTQPNASITTAVFDDNVAEPDETYTTSLLPIPDANYTLDPDATAINVAVTDGVPGVGGPLVSLAVDQTELNEGDPLTITLTVEGDIPEGGLEVTVDSGVGATIGEFITVGEDGNPIVEFTGLAGFPFPDADASAFTAVVTENVATISFDVFDDGPGEGPETFEFSVLDGENYDLGDDTTVTLTIDDTDDGLMPDIVGTDDGETLVGTDEDNFIQALGGEDTAAGGLGNDIIDGGDGDDVLRGDRNSRSTQDGEPGGDDIIFGGEGNDRIGGKAGDDILSGDAGDDEIFGDDGDDILMGVTGNDILVGDNFSDGSGSDTFVFGNGDGTDTILDFEVGIDSIGLVEGELVFADLTLTQDGSDTLLGVADSGETLAVLNNVQASDLDESSFVIVPDVSNINEALQL